MLHHSCSKAASGLGSLPTASSCSAHRRRNSSNALPCRVRGWFAQAPPRCRPIAPVRARALPVDFFRTAGFVDWHHHNAHVLAGAAMSTIHWDYSAGLPRRPTRFRPPAGRVRPPGSRQEAGAALLGTPMTPQVALNDLRPHVDSRGRPEGNEPGLGVSEIVRLNTAREDNQIVL